MLAAVCGGVIQPACQCITILCKCVVSKVDHVKHIDTNFNELKDEAESLYQRMADVKCVIKRDEVQMIPTNECQNWIDKVDKAKNEVKALETKYSNGRKWLCGWCPFFSRLNLSKDMVKMMENVRKLKEEGRLENGIVARRPQAEIAKMFRPRKKKEIPSHQAIEEKIIDFLNDQAVKRIGIWGMPGVGKTRILKKLKHNVKITEMFDIVICANVTEKPIMQRQIMQCLDISVNDDNERNIGVIISTTLATRKYLFLLDNVSEIVDLNDVGILEDHEDGKVVFATRFKDSCPFMDATDEIQVEKLCDTEAWELFRDTVGDDVDRQPIKYLAEQVVKECGGLLKVIDIVAKSLNRKTDERLWRDALNKLQSPDTQIKYLDEILRTLKLGYDALKDDAEKNCFLYGALYPEDGEICEDYLMECWKAEGFIVGVEKLRDARDRGHVILDELINKSLIERVRVRYVKMHALLRRLALRITSPNEEKCKLLVRRKGMQEAPSEEEWKGSKRVSLVDNQLCCLPEGLDCCMLSTLLLQRNPDLTLIPESFFVSMRNLRVLDLHGTGIKKLPSSLFSLPSLKALYLNSCGHLVELPTKIEALDVLEVLDIRGTQIINVPIETGKLAHLKCLRFSFIDVGRHNNDQKMPARVMFHQVLSRFPQLEELSIDVEGNYPGWNDILDIVVQQMSALEKLSSLCFYFSKLECLQNFTERSQSWKKKPFQSFKILVGSHGSVNSQGLDDSEYKIHRFLRFSSGEDIHPTILEVLGYADAFELVGNKSVQKFSDVEIEKMTQLKVCLIEECNEIESINNSSIGTTNAALKFLQKLEMINLPKLRYVWEGQLHSESFAKLTTLTVKGCPEMKYIFSRGVIKQLSKLQKLRVENCSKIEQIITEADNEIQECSVLPELLTLTLIELPKLVKICREELVWRSLEKIQILACEELKRLPLRTDNGKKLRLIECEENWWCALVWENSKVEGMLRPLCRFS